MAPGARKKKASFISWRKLFRLDKIAGKVAAMTWRKSSGRTVDKPRRLYLRYVTNCHFLGLNAATARQAVRPSTLRFLHPAIAAGIATLIASVMTAFT
jgi:hypothetical protein